MKTILLLPLLPFLLIFCTFHQTTCFQQQGCQPRYQSCCRYKQLKLFSRLPPKQGAESTTPLSAETIISRAASLLSYQCIEEQLRLALVGVKDKKKYAPQFDHGVRGQLEDFGSAAAAADSANEDNIVDLFLSTLASANHTSGTGSRDCNAGLSICRDLLEHTTDDIQSTPPTRTLIGTIDGMDVLLLRDQQDNNRFSFLLSADRAKGRKLARLLAELNDSGRVVIRGMHVHEQHRQKRLSTLLVAVLCRFCYLALGSYPQTFVMNKPVLCATLSSLGFVPETTKWPAWVAPHQSNPSVTLMSSTKDGPALGPRFPHSVRKAQQIEMVENDGYMDPDNNKKARKIHLLTKFLSPDTDSLLEERLENSRCTFYSARIVSFLATVENAKGPMFQRSKAVSNQPKASARIQRMKSACSERMPK